MTTSRETDWMDHPVIRHLVDEASTLQLSERLTLLKGLVPGVAREMAPREFDAFLTELRLKGERYYDATRHPGTGRGERHVPGERDIESRD